MDGKPSRKNGEEKINTGERGETEHDGEEVQSFHTANIGSNESMSHLQLTTDQMTKEPIVSEAR